MTVPHTEILLPFVAGGAALVAMTITSSDIVDVIEALGTFAAATAAAYSIIIATRMKAVAAKVDVIEGHVNSAATKAAGIIAAQETQMVLLRETIENQKQTAALLAQSLATRTATVKKK